MNYKNIYIEIGLWDRGQYSIKSTIMMKFKNKSIANKNLVLFWYGNFLILIHINILKNNNSLNNYRSNAIYEYSV